MLSRVLQDSTHRITIQMVIKTSHVKLFDHALHVLGKTLRVRITVDNTRKCTVYVMLIMISKHSGMLLCVLYCHDLLIDYCVCNFVVCCNWLL